MAESPHTVTGFLEHLRARMIEHSVLRGQVLSFVQTNDGAGAGAGITFLERPVVATATIVLPEGILGTITDHVIGIGEQLQSASFGWATGSAAPLSAGPSTEPPAESPEPVQAATMRLGQGNWLAVQGKNESGFLRRSLSKPLQYPRHHTLPLVR